MEEKVKKPSLFKQRIAAIKTNINGDGFPQAVNILQKEPSPIISQNCSGSIIEDQPVKLEKALIDSIKGQSLLKDDDVKKIEQQNWAAVQAMSEEQRQQMVRQINSQLNEKFIKRLKKHPINEFIKVPPPPQQQPTNQDKIQQEEKPQINESWETLLKINVETNKLCYTEQNEEHLVSAHRMIQMIGSENNQSQIIGSKIAAKFVESLADLATSKSRQLVIINYVPLHLSIIFERCTYLLFEPMIKRARKTTFRGAFVEITTHTAEIITKIYRYLSKSHKESLLKQLKALIDKCKSFKIDKEGMESLIGSLDTVCSALSQHSNKVEEEDWASMKQHSDIMLQLILIEQSQPSYLNSYASSTLDFVDKSSDLTEIIEVQCFVYEIVNRFIQRKTKQLYLNLQVFRNIWRPIIDVISVKLFTKVVNIELQVIFQVIFLARFAGGVTWERIISSMEHLSSIKHMIPHFVLFNTLSDQKSAGLREENLQSLNEVFNWLSKTLSNSQSKLNPNFIIGTLLELFLQEEQYYSQLDQSILQKLLTSIAVNASTEFNIIFTEQKIRTLIKNYGYNSFGNEVFTNLLLFVAIKGSPDLEALILREVIARYTSNFIGAASRLKVELKEIQGSRLAANQDAKSEILQSFKGQSEKNVLFAYLHS